jgi:hypothetical protein
LILLFHASIFFGMWMFTLSFCSNTVC